MITEARGIPRKDGHLDRPASVQLSREQLRGAAMTKQCYKCKETKPTDEFYKHAQAKDGLHTYCKACCKADRDTYTVEYKAFCSMRARCNKGRTDHRWYYDKGIKVCDRWREYKNFLADMGPKPTPKHQIDRIDPAKDYGPDNCRWVTAKQNLRRKSNVKITMDIANKMRELVRAGMTRGEVAKVYKVATTTVSNVLMGLIWNDGDVEPIVSKSGRISRKPEDIARVYRNLECVEMEEGLVDAIDTVFGGE